MILSRRKKENEFEETKVRGKWGGKKREEWVGTKRDPRKPRTGREVRDLGAQGPGSSVPQTKVELVLVALDMHSVTGPLMPCPFSLSHGTMKLVWPGFGSNTMITPLSE